MRIKKKIQINILKHEHILSFIILFVFFYTIYQFNKILLQNFQEKNHQFTRQYCFISINYFLSSFVYGLIYIPMYVFDKQYFHRFKANDIPWPWEQSPQIWKTELPKILINYVTF